MTGFSLSDTVIGSDILDETKLKPWWEKILEYCFRALVFTSFMMVYAVESSKPTRCIQSHNENYSLSGPELLYVNNICFQELHFVLRYSGHLALLGCTLLYLPSVWWRLRPSVIAIFHTVWKVDLILRKKHFAKIEHFIAEPLPDSRDKNKTVANDVRTLMYLSGESCSLLDFYIIRNGLTVFVLILCFALALVWLYYTISFDYAFPCNLDSSTKGSVKCVQFLCSNELTHKIFLYAIIWFILTFAATVCACWAMYTAKNSSLGECKHLTVPAQQISQNYAFITMFSNHSHPLHQSTRTMLYMFNEKKMEDNMVQHLNKIQVDWDENFLILFTKMFVDGQKKLANEIFNQSLLYPKHDQPVRYFNLIYKYTLDVKDYEKYCTLHIFLHPRIERNEFSEIMCPCENIELDEIDLKSFFSAMLETTYDKESETYHIAVFKHLVNGLKTNTSWKDRKKILETKLKKAPITQELKDTCLRDFEVKTPPTRRSNTSSSKRSPIGDKTFTGDESPGSSK